MIASAAGLVPGDHVCWVYESDAELRAMMVAYVREGIQDGQRVLWHTSDDPSEVVRILESGGLPVAELERRGQLEVGDAREAYAPDGRLDPDRVAAEYVEATERARADGFTTLRASGDPWWALADPELRDALIAYEYRAQGVIDETGMVGLCAYDRRRCAGVGLRALAAVHAASVGPRRAVGVSFTVRPERDGSVAVDGEVDVGGGDLLEGVLRSVIDGARPRPRLDLRGLRFVDVNGLQALARAADRMGGTPEIVGARPIVRRCWSLLDLEDVTPVRFTN